MCAASAAKADFEIVLGDGVMTSAIQMLRKYINLTPAVVIGIKMAEREGFLDNT